MKTKLYATFNKLACELNQNTFNAPNDEYAKHMIENSFYNKEGKVDANQIRVAKNYKLCCLGEYDTDLGLTGLGCDYRTVCEFSEIAENIEHSPKSE